MENEQEGIRLETIDSEAEGIVLPSVEEEVDTETVDTETETETTTKIDEEKESLKRGVNAERSKRKAAEKKARELEDRIKALEEANRTPEKTTFDTLIESGVDESIAKSIAAAIDKKQSSNSELEKKLANTNFEIALTKKSKEQGFEDIEEYSDEIKELVDKGLTLEQSYYAVTYNKPKTKDTKSEIERKVEAKLQNNQARKEILGNYNSNSGGTSVSKTKINISNEELAIAAMSGLTPEEYVAVRDADSVKDYNKYTATKKK
jgi:chromosome segregation ATPase